MKLIVWMSEPLSSTLRDRLPSQSMVTYASSRSEFLELERQPDTISFVDKSSLGALSGVPPPGPTIAICEDSLPVAIGWLGTFPWLSQIVSTSAVNHPLATEHLGNVIRSVSSGRVPRLLDWVPASVTGRRVKLAQASKRATRLEKMGEFFESNGVTQRSIQVLRDAAEELLTNAFYDAPVAAGVLSQPISRTRDVCLSDESACDMVYGCRDDLAIVRVRDPFGSLTRTRLVDVLTRCARSDMQVQVDETMGGAGLGLWRIFSGASIVGISVAGDHSTEILVGIWKRAAAGVRPFGIHLFFKERTKQQRWSSLDADSSSTSTAVTFTTKA